MWPDCYFDDDVSPRFPVDFFVYKAENKQRVEPEKNIDSAQLATLCCPNDFLDSYLNNDTVVVAVTDNKNIVNDFFDLGQHRTFLVCRMGDTTSLRLTPKNHFLPAVAGCENVILIPPMHITYWML